ncbi:hypothetical protein BC749_101372 [Flavobacterium araucananum]|uniref:Uncharacterized protein n=1 Tax=Flavobacterium araucananum TaxID=946678 RepID=A0A227P8J4_9FLAO|nr:hypothetical protein [Flavobacterium araucananum]OXG05516.1 hypothetical protein B0A64_12460 [Flavobacterium araucananum]PWK02308.1 hypothetical protein BC749_101372 [Flavobacterium araucananum]
MDWFNKISRGLILSNYDVIFSEQRGKKLKNKIQIIKISFISIIIIFVTSCKVTTKDYLIIHSIDNMVQTRHYFHKNDQEFARVFGNDEKSDSITFTRINDDLLITTFSYDNEHRIRIEDGNVYIGTERIKYSKHGINHIYVYPIESLSQNDEDIEHVMNKMCGSCKSNNNKFYYRDCPFIGPESLDIQYMATGSIITSGQIIKNKRNKFKQINVEIEHFDSIFSYRRLYYYKHNTLSKIKTIVSDSNSTNYYLDSYVKINLK